MRGRGGRGDLQHEDPGEGGGAARLCFSGFLS